MKKRTKKDFLELISKLATRYKKKMDMAYKNHEVEVKSLLVGFASSYNDLMNGYEGASQSD